MVDREYFQGRNDLQEKIIIARSARFDQMCYFDYYSLWFSLYVCTLCLHEQMIHLST